jgi:ribokinase
MAYDFITIGGATRDISFFTNEGILIDNKHDLLRQKLLAFEHGAKIKVDKFHYTYGGGGTNTAVNLANFGFKVACLAAVGSDENGREILKNLKAKKVDTKLIKRVVGDSGFSFILIDKSERIIFTQRGVNSSLVIDKKSEKFLETTKNIYISSLSGDWLKNLDKIFKIAENKKIKVSWNPSQSQYQVGLKKLSPFLKQTYLFAINKDEAIELALMSQTKKLSAKFLNDEKNLLKIIKSFGPEMVMITSGAAGAFVYDGKSFYYQGILKEKRRVDMTGVGDVFNSTFVAGLNIYEENIKKALLLAARNTASKIAHLGAQNGLIKLKK